MKLKEIYKSAVDLGIKADPRGRRRISKGLDNAKKEYNEAKPKDKAYLDNDKLINPYADTRILYGKDDLEVKNILVGIDIEVGEILLADRLIQKGKKIDLVIAHHPEGRAMAAFHEVMHMQADILNKLGVPINVAEGILKKRIDEVGRRVMPVNHNRAVDAAKLLDIPLMCIHTPADNHVTSYLQNLMDEKQPDTIDEVLDIIMDIPEYQRAAENSCAPKILAGGKSNRCGKVFVDMTGGTGGSKEAFQKLAQTDIGTIVGMHIGEEHLKEAEKNHINVLIAGHMPSDSLGINLLLDKIFQNEKMQIIECSGFRRVERTVSD